MINKHQNIANIIILILGIMVFVFKPLQAISQANSILDSTIAYKAKNITLYQGLNEIGTIINYEFSYNSDLIASERVIKVHYNEITVNDLLNKILNDTMLCFCIADKQIIIRKKNSLNSLSLSVIRAESKSFVQIRGSIFNKKTGEALAFANVSLLGKSIGTITNEKGGFNLKIDYSNMIDTLAVSYIGYKNSYIPMKQLSMYNNTIYLEEDLVQIKEVVIRINDAKAILKKSLDKIKDNYYTDPYYITSFYREIVTSHNGLESITEAVIDVYKSPYQGMFSDQIKLVKSRKNEYYTQEDTFSLKLKGGLYASLYLDAIKNPSYFLMEEYFHNYSYNISNVVTFDNSSAYVISFKPRIYLEDKSFEGKIYVNTENLAIVACEFNITTDAIGKIGNMLVVKKRFGTRVKPTAVKYIINYRKLNGKYYMNLARGELDFKVKYRRKLFSSDFKTVFEFASNNIDTVEVKRFERIETISAHDVFIDEDFQYDHQFWGDYNYISPDETLEEALIRINRKIDAIKEEVD